MCDILLKVKWWGPVRMDQGQFRKVVSDVATLLRSEGLATSGLEHLLDDPAMLEIVGKWPPDGKLPGDPGAIEISTRLLERARFDLLKIKPEAHAAKHLQDVIQHLRAHIVSFRSAARPGEAPDSGQADSSDIVGPWPPGGDT